MDHHVQERHPSLIIYGILGLPVIDLKEVWNGVIDDFVIRLYGVLCELKFRNGFIMDGLAAIEDTDNINERFVQ